MQLTQDQLVAEFQDAVLELYFARKRITALELEVGALRARLTAQEEAAEAAGAPVGTAG